MGVASASDHSGRFVLFAAVGVFNTAVDFVVFSAAVFLGFAPALANILAFAAANPLSYVINAKVTFRRNARAAAMSFPGYGKFLTAHLASLAISTAVVFFFAPRIGPFAAKAAAVGVTVFINYFASAFLVFPSRD